MRLPRSLVFVCSPWFHTYTTFSLLGIKSLLVLLFEIVKRATVQELGYKRTVRSESFRPVVAAGKSTKIFD